VFGGVCELLLRFGGSWAKKIPWNNLGKVSPETSYFDFNWVVKGVEGAAARFASNL